MALKCKCGGVLKRIAIDCYQCEICGIKQAIGFLSIDNNPINKLEKIKPNTNNQYDDFIKDMNKRITENLMIRGDLFGTRYRQ
ncbi:MAG: hypothetical protein K0Q53_110 [Massilibacillus sp.]|jgi:hypothetical protein|nr:hypothetical protein [Massilibacillus sp.]